MQQMEKEAVCGWKGGGANLLHHRFPQSLLLRVALAKLVPPPPRMVLPLRIVISHKGVIIYISQPRFAPLRLSQLLHVGVRLLLRASGITA